MMKEISEYEGDENEIKDCLKQSLKKQGLSEDLLEERMKNPINMVNSSNLDHMIDIYHRVIIRK